MLSNSRKTFSRGQSASAADRVDCGLAAGVTGGEAADRAVGKASGRPTVAEDFAAVLGGGRRTAARGARKEAAEAKVAVARRADHQRGEDRPSRAYRESLSRGRAEKDCRLSHTRPVWRLENGRAVLVAYEIYRGPRNQYGKIPGVFGRSEFGAEITLAIAYQVYVVGLSFDKVCLLMNFFQHLKLRKSQANALLKQLCGNGRRSSIGCACCWQTRSWCIPMRRAGASTACGHFSPRRCGYCSSAYIRMRRRYGRFSIQRRSQGL